MVEKKTSKFVLTIVDIQKSVIWKFDFWEEYLLTCQVFDLKWGILYFPYFHLFILFEIENELMNERMNIYCFVTSYTYNTTTAKEVIILRILIFTKVWNTNNIFNIFPYT